LLYPIFVETKVTRKKGVLDFKRDAMAVYSSTSNTNIGSLKSEKTGSLESEKSGPYKSKPGS